MTVPNQPGPGRQDDRYGEGDIPDEELEKEEELNKGSVPGPVTVTGVPVVTFVTPGDTTSLRQGRRSRDEDSER